MLPTSARISRTCGRKGNLFHLFLVPGSEKIEPRGRSHAMEPGRWGGLCLEGGRSVGS